jgi:hypothetical protein
LQVYGLRSGRASWCLFVVIASACALAVRRRFENHGCEAI